MTKSEAIETVNNHLKKLDLNNNTANIAKITDVMFD